MSSVGSTVADHALKISTAWMDGAFALIGRLSKNVPMPTYAKAALQVSELTHTAIFTGADAALSGSTQKALLGTVSGLAIGAVAVASAATFGAGAIGVGAAAFIASYVGSIAFDIAYGYAVERGIVDGNELSRLISDTKLFGEKSADYLSSLLNDLSSPIDTWEQARDWAANSYDDLRYWLFGELGDLIEINFLQFIDDSLAAGGQNFVAQFDENQAALQTAASLGVDAAFAEAITGGSPLLHYDGGMNATVSVGSSKIIVPKDELQSFALDPEGDGIIVRLSADDGLSRAIRLDPATGAASVEIGGNTVLTVPAGSNVSVTENAIVIETASNGWTKTYTVTGATVAEHFAIDAGTIQVASSIAAAVDDFAEKERNKVQERLMEHLRQPIPSIDTSSLITVTVVGFGEEADNSLMKVTTQTSGELQTTVPWDPHNITAVNSGIVISDVRTEVATLGVAWDGLNLTTLSNATDVNAIITEGFRPANGNIIENPDFDFDVSSALAGAFFGPIINTSWDIAADRTFVDPLVLDLDGDGVTLTDYSSAPVLFDIDNDGGSKEITGWVSTTDGIVVHDLNGNGIIDTIAETLSEFYGGTAGQDGEEGQRRFSDGFAALDSLDSNHDGVFTAFDAAWSQLRIWVDPNHDGLSFIDANGNGIRDAGEESELRTLAELGITAIDLTADRTSGRIRSGNEVLAAGTFTRMVDGSPVIAEALSARFLANPMGSTAQSSGTGTTVTTETVDGAVAAYVAGNAGEVIDVAALGVVNAYGGDGDDVLTGDGQNNWLAGSIGRDTFNGGAGDDVLLVDADDDLEQSNAGDGLDVVQVIGDAGVTIILAEMHAEVAKGGDGTDTIIGGGASNVFVSAGAGDDLVIGGIADDALSGEEGDDIVSGLRGNDLIRGHRGNDTLSGDDGDDIIEGGDGDDEIAGGTGNDVMTGGAGDDLIDGGDGIDLAQYSGSFADYRIVRTDDGVLVSDTRGIDGTDFLTGIERLGFSDITWADYTMESPMPAKDVIDVPSRAGSPMTVDGIYYANAILIAKMDLLKNDLDWQGDALRIREVSDVVGGTARVTSSGDVLFLPNATFMGMMNFAYRVVDSKGYAGAQVELVTTGELAEMKASVTLRTPEMPKDGLLASQWYINAANILPVWEDYTGKGVHMAMIEPGMPFAVSTELFDWRHSDLMPNVDRNWLAAGRGDASGETFSAHATMVAGIMVAASNGEGAVGVAYGATLAGYGLENESIAVEMNARLAVYQDYDIVNNSWDLEAQFNSPYTPIGSIGEPVYNAITYGRDGKGTIVVFSGGNSRANGGNTNSSYFSAITGTVVVGAVNAPGDLGSLVLGQKPFSNPGASILVSAPGSNIQSTSYLVKSDNGSVFGSEFAAAQGTSFAAPIVSGIVALMLEANPNLGCRDVQQILAASARKINDPNGTDWVINGAKNWNGGGMHVSHDYGFGEVDALAAVRLAETWAIWQTPLTAYNETMLSASSTVSAVIPDGSGALTRTLQVSGNEIVETAQLIVKLDHARWGDLIIKLISPSGTESVLMNRAGKAPGSDGSDFGSTESGTLEWSFVTTHCRGEAAAGTWTVKVIDAVTGAVGSVQRVELKIWGLNSSGDTYVYTNEFASFNATERIRLTDTNGGADFLNAAAVSSDSVIDLAVNGSCRIAGKYFTVDGNIESAFGGDGSDIIRGNDVYNVLQGGRGSDLLDGRGGDDVLDGGAGNDTLTGGAGMDFYVIRAEAGAVDVITDYSLTSGNEKIILVGFEGMTDTAQISKSQSGADTYIALPGNQYIVMKNVAQSSVAEQCFVFMSDSSMLEEYLWLLNGKARGWGTAGSDQGWTQPGNGVAYFAMAGNDLILSQTADDMLDGGDGNDSLAGDYGAVIGADWLEGGAGNDELQAGGGNDVLKGGSGNDWLNCGDGNDWANGGSGDDLIAGYNGDDTLIGGSGNDILYGGAGSDTVTLDGDTGVVAAGDPQYYGTRLGEAGADIFKILPSGVVSADYVVDGATLYAGNLIADFSPTEPGEFIDFSELPWLKSIADLAFAAIVVGGVECTRVSASDGTNSVAIHLYGVKPSDLKTNHFNFSVAAGSVYGGAGDDILAGDAGGNWLDGRAGGDVMEGRTDDDTYIVDDVRDVVLELPGGGYDIVQASVTFTLADNAEQLQLTGTQSISGYGNDADNRLVGNIGANRLDGGVGADNMAGGAGNDTYVVDDIGDKVVEVAGGGIDTIESSVSRILSAEIEHLVLTGDVAINGTGNALDNVITGNGDDNLLDGAAGADTMIGGLGNDTYVVDQTGDVVQEVTDEGFDIVLAQIDYTLAGNVEGLMLATGVVLGIGNELDNVIFGSSVNNTLDGGGGSDYILGGDGADTLLGNTGDDELDGGDGNDTLTGGDGADMLTGGGGADRLDGGLGSDTVSYAGNTAGVVVNLGTGSVSGGDATGDVLVGIENVIGTTHADTLTGNGGANTLAGGAGNDTLSGAGGEDIALFAGSLFDYQVTHNPGDTWSVQDLVGRDGTDVLNGIEVARFTDHEIYLDGRNNAPIVEGPLNQETSDFGGGQFSADLLDGAWDLETPSALFVAEITQIGGRSLNFSVNDGIFSFDRTQLDFLALGENETLNFTYDVSDGTAAVSQSLSVTVEGWNEAPLAADDFAATDEETPLVLSAAALLANDTDVDAGDTKELVSVSAISACGAAVRIENGSVVYDPRAAAALQVLGAGQTATDTFTYTMRDAAGATATATVTVAVGGRDDLPTPDGIYRIGTESLVNTVTAGWQSGPKGAGLANGGFVVTWVDSGPVSDGEGSSIKAQMFGPAGDKVGTEFLVNTTTASYQDQPVAAGLANGGFVIAWNDDSGALGDDSRGIKAQVFDAVGAKLGPEFRVNTATASSQAWPSVTALSGGGFVVAWDDSSGMGGDSDHSVQAQIFDATGAKVGPELLVNTTTAGWQGLVTITGLANGGFVATWENQPNSGGGYGIEGQLFDAAGGKIGSEFEINTSATSGLDTRPTVAALADGGFVVAWWGTTAKAQMFDASGNKVGSALALTDPTQYHAPLGIAGLAGGGFVVAWVDYRGTLGDSDWCGVTAQVYGSDGTRIGEDFRVNTQIASSQGSPAVTALADGGFAITWTDSSGTLGDASGTSVKMQVFGDARALATAKTATAKTFTGTAGSDTLAGGVGADILVGGAGDDLLIGGGGNDIYVFGTGDGHDLVDNSSAGRTAAEGAAEIGVSKLQLWLDRAGDDLAIRILGNQDQLTIDDWFVDSNHQLASTRSSDGYVLGNGAVDQLVSAMATFEANYAASHNGVAFDPTTANGTITDAAVLAAVNTAWRQAAA